MAISKTFNAAPKGIITSPLLLTITTTNTVVIIIVIITTMSNAWINILTNEKENII